MINSLLSFQPLFYYITIVVFAFSLVAISIPSIIHICNKYELYDVSDLHRKTHQYSISRLGGISIFCSFIVTLLLFAGTVNFHQPNFLIISCIILFALGLKDDIYGVNFRTKFVMQALVAVILVVFGDFKLDNFYGVFNIWEINPVFSLIISVILIVFINNSFNLIDGIDGLAGTIGSIVTLSFGVFFALINQYAFAFIAFAMFGALLGFLKYNLFPAKIFMGDTGALIIGLVCAVLAIKFIELNKFNLGSNYFYSSGPAVAVAVLIVPIFDSLRVFTIRILHKKSPFKGDDNHIHHRLNQIGFNHSQIVLILAIYNVSMILLVAYFHDLGNYVLIFMQFLICIAFNVVLTYVKGKKKVKDYTFSDVLFKDTLRVY